MRSGKSVTLILGALLAIGLARCGADPTTPGTTGKDGGAPAAPDAASAGADAASAGQDAASSGTDAGAGADAGSTGDAGAKPVLPNVTATVVQLRTDTATYSDIVSFPAKPKSIVTLKGVVVVGSYLHSAGDVDLYVQDAAGGPNSGIEVNYKPKTGVGPAAVGRVVDVIGCVRTDFGVLQLNYCADSKNTQPGVTDLSAGTVPAHDTFSAATLKFDATTHDDHLGQPIQITELMAIDSTTPPECKSGTSYFCYTMKDPAGNLVHLQTRFIHKCSTTQLAGPFKDLIGAWDWYQDSATKTLYRSISPFDCASLHQ